MFSAINIIIGILWLISAVVDYSEFCYLWQLKEYRWDRFRDFFSTLQGKRYWLRYALLFRSCIAIIAIFWPFNHILIIKYWLLGLLIIDALCSLYKVYARKLRRPKITSKALAIMALAIVLEGGLFVLLHDWTAMFLLLMVRLPIISFAVAVAYAPTRLVKEYFIFKATQKLKKYPNLVVIGITGSYGKTSTKEFLAHILSGKFNVVKTIANQNNDYGISQCVLKNDLSRADVLIVEMGAYRVGDIDLYCKMVKPKIGILTAINEQHLSLFGNIKNTQKAKYALLRSLPKDGLAVTNSDNEYCREFLGKLTIPVQTFGKDSMFHPACRINSTLSSTDSVKGNYTIGNENISLELPFSGAQYAVNLAPCLIVAKYLGMPSTEIIERCRAMPSPNQTRIVQYGKATIIDNSYNSNPAGFEASLDLLSQIGQGRKKIVITRGMLELGSESKSLHEKIGKKIAGIANELVIITPDFVAPLKKGAGAITVKEVFDHVELKNIMEAQKDTNTVILIENRVPENIKTFLTSL